MENKKSRLVIIDFQFMYYKTYFTRKSGRLRRLSHKGVSTEMIYYPLKDVMNMIRSCGEGASVAVCFDSKAEKKHNNADYKSNRKSTLSEEDYFNIAEIQRLLTEMGYSTYKIEGKEADDIAVSLAEEYRDDFGATVIVTPDIDLGVAIKDNVFLYRYKTKSGYTAIGRKNFCSEVAREMKVRQMPFNGISIYKVTVGDKSDGIAGVRGFGPKAFDTLISEIGKIEENLDFSSLNKESTLELLEKVSKTSRVLDESKMEEVRVAADLVFIEHIDNLEKPILRDVTDEDKQKALDLYGINYSKL